MRLLALSSARNLLLATAVAVFLTLASQPSHAQDDPPDQTGRLSYVSGTVSIQPANVDNWGQAYPNLPLGPGDRIFTDSDGRAEIQVGRTFVRIGPNSDVAFVNALPNAIHFGVAQGSVHIHTLGMWPGQVLGIYTPSGTTVVTQPGEIRVDVLPDEGAAVFTVTNLPDYAYVYGAGGFSEHVGNGQSLELMGSNPVSPQWLQPADPDDLDRWSQQRDWQIANAASYNYVSPEIPGAYELDASGTWQPGTDYGAIWFPNNVPAGWAPYHYGHWVNHAPWGWVWVEDESWGYAPFHYGRWVSYGGRWGWVPGPPAAHPVWSPALVVFAGGIHFGGVGVSVWFPLGPGEPYRPWYPCSPHYIDQVNISNITESRVVHVQTTYVNIVNVTNVTYINRTTGATAMNHDDFASGRSAAQASVKIDVHQLDHVTALDRPEPKPTAASFVGRPPVRPVPVKAERPTLINDQGKLVSAKPGAQPVEPPVKPVPPARPLAGHTVVAPPPGATRQPAKTSPTPVTPAIKPAPAPPSKPVSSPVVQPATKPAAPPAKTAPAAATKPAAPTATNPAAPTAPKPATPQAAKPAPPPPAQPAAKTDKDKKKDKEEKKNEDTTPK
jgi:hypothetical protein